MVMHTVQTLSHGEGTHVKAPGFGSGQSQTHPYTSEFSGFYDHGMYRYQPKLCPLGVVCLKELSQLTHNG
jgi:hypothetical protein